MAHQQCRWSNRPTNCSCRYRLMRRWPCTCCGSLSCTVFYPGRHRWVRWTSSVSDQGVERARERWEFNSRNEDTHHFDINVGIAARQILQRPEEIRFGRPRVFPPRDQQADVYLTLDRRRPQSVVYYWPVPCEYRWETVIGSCRKETSAREYFFFRTESYVILNNMKYLRRLNFDIK